MQTKRAPDIQPLALTTPNTASFIPEKVIPIWCHAILLKSLSLTRDVFYLKYAGCRPFPICMLIAIRPARYWEPKKGADKGPGTVDSWPEPCALRRKT